MFPPFDKLLAFGQRNFDMVVKKDFYVCRGTFGAKRCFFQNNQLPFLICRKWGKCFRPLAESFSPVLSRMHSLCPEEQFDENDFFEKQFKFKCFTDIEDNVMGLLPIFFDRVVENAFQMPGESFRERKICKSFFVSQQFGIPLEIVFFLFGHWAKTFKHSVCKFLAVGHNCTLHVQRRRLSKNCFEEKIITFYVFKATFFSEKKCIFTSAETDGKNVLPLDISSSASENGILRVQKINLSEKNFIQKVIFFKSFANNEVNFIGLVPNIFRQSCVFFVPRV